MDININKSLRAKNLSKLKNKRAIQGIILHDTAGSGTHGDTKYLATDPENRKIGVDFTVERDGTIYQLNPDLEMYYTAHAGRSTHWKAKDLIGPDVNRACVGIEIVQKANLKLVPVWPEVQVRAVAYLCAWLCINFDMDKTDITTHAAIITDGSRSDPREWPFTKFWANFNIDLKQAGVPHTVQSDKIEHEVETGDTLWALARKYNTTIEKLKALNDLVGNTIKKGQTLIVKD